MSIFKNPDLYPTPKTLAFQMLSKVKHWGKIKSILEPSAGMGDLVESIKDKCRHSNVDISAIMDYSNKAYKDLTPKEKEMVKDFDCGEKEYKKIESHLVLNHFNEQLLLGA